MVNPGTPKISADLVRTLLRSRGKISGATLTCAAAALLGCPEATDDEKVRFYMLLIKRLEQIAQDDECRANVHKIVRYPDEVKVEDAAARALQLRRSVEKFMRTGCAMPVAARPAGARPRFLCASKFVRSRFFKTETVRFDFWPKHLHFPRRPT